MRVRLERGMICVQIVYGLIFLVASTGLFCWFLIDDYRFGNFVDNCVAFFILLIFLHALTNLVDGIVRLKGHKKILEINKSERHTRGGVATKKKYAAAKIFR